MSTLEKTRIDSWKAIATFLGRDLRTVQRWEKERSLPVHRIPGDRGRVFTYTEELAAWLDRGAPAFEADESDTLEPEAADPALPALPAETADPVEAAASLLQESVLPALVDRKPQVGSGPRWGWAAGFVMIVLAVAIPFALGSHAWKAAAPTATAETSSGGSANPAAEAAFLQGRFLWNQRKPDSLQRALQSFRQAEILDPGFAAAYAGEAETYALLPEFAAMPARQAFADAKAAAQKAVTLDPKSASAHRVLAFALLYGDWDANAALPEFDRAEALDPKSAQTHHWYANALMTLRRRDQAAVEMQKARELDPSSISMLTDQVLLDRLRGANLQDCLQRLRELSQAQRDFVLPLRYMAFFLLDAGQMDSWASQVREVANQSALPEDRRLAQVAIGLQSARAPSDVYLRTLCALRADPVVVRAMSPASLADVCLRAGDAAAGAALWRETYLEHSPRFLSFAAGPLHPALAGNTDMEHLRSTVHLPLAAAQ